MKMHFAVLSVTAVVLPLAAQPASQLPVPAGWAVINDGTARGDLNRDGRPDLALAIRPHDEAKRLAAGAKARRRLLVFFRQPDGSLRQVFANETAIMGADEGGMLGDPFQSLRIQRGALVIDHWGGSRENWEYTNRYRFEGGQWRLIGLRSAVRDRLSSDFSSRDTNLVTGAVVYTLVRNNKSSTRRFMELRPAPAGQTGPRFTLGDGSSLSATATGTEIGINVRLVRPNTTFRLLTASGRVIPVIATQREGASQSVRIARNALPFNAAYLDGGTSWNGATPQPNQVAEVMLEVAGTRPGQVATRRYPAQIVVGPQARFTLPPLKTP